MFSSFTSLNASNLAHKINKSAASLLSAPTKGYTGNCPFLQGLSKVSRQTNCSTTEQSAAESKAADLFAVSGNSCAQDTDASSPPTVDSSFRQASSAQNCPNHYHESLGSFYETQRQFEQQQQKHDGREANCAPIGGHQDRTTNQSEEAVKILVESKDREQQSECTVVTLAPANNQATSSSAHKVKQPFEHSEPIYDYGKKFNELIKRKKDDESYRVFRRVRRFSSSFPLGTEQDRPVTIWCSNDYFGMSSHPKVREAILKALNEYGAGSGGTRNIAGNSPVHEDLEWELADLHQKEAALLFSSCYVANDSTLYTLLKLMPNCVVFSDAGNHASMIQGIRNSGAKRHIFRAFDAEDLEAKLKLEPLGAPKIVAFETVHSMTGDISDVGRMCDIAHHYGAITFVDEVHAVGLYGERGAGIGQRDGCMEKIDIVSGTLGKAYGNCGGYIAGSAQMVDVVRSYAAGFIFTTSLPPTVASGATESVRILKGDEGRYLRQSQQNNVFHMKKALTAAGLPHYNSKSHIVPIPVGNAAKCTQVMNDLLNQGHYIQSINYPTVPRGSERLRVSLTPFHSEQMIDSLIEKLVAVWQRNGLDFLPPVDIPNQCRRHQMMNSARDTQVGRSLWCHLCHKEMNLCAQMPQKSENIVV